MIAARRWRVCEHGDTVPVLCRLPSGMTDREWKGRSIDRCIAPLVKALQEGGINMLGSCCGHGEVKGNICLEDGRGLLVLSPEEFNTWLDDAIKGGGGE